MRFTGPWSIERIHAHLAETVVPLRLACVEASGHPRVLSLWFEWRDEALWCATSPHSRLASWLAAEPRCGFEVVPDAPPYSGVRGRARATLDDGTAPKYSSASSIATSDHARRDSRAGCSHAKRTKSRSASIRSRSRVSISAHACAEALARCDESRMKA